MTEDLLPRSPDSGWPIVEEYAHFKKAIMQNPDCTRKEADRVVVRDAFAPGEREGEVATAQRFVRVRGGTISWETDNPAHPITSIDDDPETLDRISIEERILVAGVVRKRSGIVYREYTEDDPAGARVVIEKVENYTVVTDTGEKVGTLTTRVEAATGRILATRHVAS